MLDDMGYEVLAGFVECIWGYLGIWISCYIGVSIWVDHLGFRVPLREYLGNVKCTLRWWKLKMASLTR